MRKFPSRAALAAFALVIGVATGAPSFVAEATARDYGHSDGSFYGHGRYHDGGGGGGARGGYHGGGGAHGGYHGGGGGADGGYQGSDGHGGRGGDGNGQPGDGDNGVRIHCGAIVAGEGPACR